MNNNLKIMDWVKEKLGTDDFLTVEKIRSAEQNNVFKVKTNNGNFILKQGPGLSSEKDRLVWLNGKLPVPKVIAWQNGNEQEELLMTCIEGEDLAFLSKKIPKEELTKLLASTLRQIHSVDIKDCPFGEKNKDFVFVHGDACLPNFIILDGKLSGIIDLGDSGIDNKEKDLAAAVWSLDYNYGPALGVPFLEAYGIPSPTNKEVEILRLKYESDWSERFNESQNSEPIIKH